MLLLWGGFATSLVKAQDGFTRLNVSIVPEDARMRIDGSEIILTVNDGKATANIDVESGSRKIEVWHPYFETHVETLDLIGTTACSEVFDPGELDTSINILEEGEPIIGFLEFGNRIVSQEGILISYGLSSETPETIVEVALGVRFENIDGPMVTAFLLNGF